MATIPSLALIPSGYKGGSPGTLYSVLPTDGTGDFDFTRSGNATRVNSEGLIELVSTNVPRLNYPLIDGVVQGCPSLLLEPQRSNLVQYSEDFSQGYWNKTNTTVLSNQVISPDGTLNADKLVENTSNVVHQINVSTSIVGNDYSFSVFVKKAERKYVSLVYSDFVRYLSQYTFDLEDGVLTDSYDYSGVTSTFVSEDYGNGWYRLTLSSNYASWSGSILTRFYIENTSTPPTVPANTYQGDGVSGVYIWGVQLEANSYSTSYIPNFGTALGVTRSAETCNNAGDVNTFNDSEGVLMAEISALANDLTRRIITITDGTLNNIVKLEYKNVSNQIEAVLYNGNTQCLILHNLSDETEFNKIAFKYKQDDFSLFVNGAKVGTDVSGSIFPSNTLSNLSFYQGNSNYFYGNTKQIQYFPTALNDSDLETLTSWDSFSDMATSQLYTIE
jgi:hypothetical protein